MYNESYEIFPLMMLVLPESIFEELKLIVFDLMGSLFQPFFPMEMGIVPRFPKVK